MSKRIPGCILVVEITHDGKKARSCFLSEKSVAHAREQMESYVDPNDSVEILFAIPLSRLEDGEYQASRLSALLRAFPPHRGDSLGPWDALSELIMLACEKYHAETCRDGVKH